MSTSSIRAAIACALAIAAAVAMPGRSYAWGPEGHNIIVETAWARLTIAQQKRFDAILAKGAGMPVSYVVHQQGKPDEDHSCGATDHSGLANWADCVRYGGEYKKTYSKHFDDMPYCPKPPAPPPPKE